MTSLTTYDDVIKYIEKRIPHYYGEYFRGSDLATCSSQLIAILNQNLTIEGDLNCRLNISADQSSSRDNLCADVSEKLRSMSIEDRNKMFDEVIKRLDQEQAFKSALVNRTNFRKEFLEKLKVELHNIPQSAQISCNSNITVDQQQNVIFKGDLNCDDDSEVNLDSTLIATQQMSCLAGIVIDNLKRDKLLRQSFNRGDNQDCVYELVQVAPCKTVNGVLQREYQVFIIENKVGRGECKIKENINLNKKTISSSGERGFFEACIPNQCEVSNWNAWSPCYDVKNAMGQMKKMQYRTRQLLKQGTNCPPDKRILKEERECPTTAMFASMMGVEDELEAVDQEIDKDKSKDDKKGDSKVSWWIIVFVMFVLVLLFLLVSKKIK
jgi:hypothetical protein